MAWGVLKNSSRLGLQEAGLLLAQWPLLVVMMGHVGEMRSDLQHIWWFDVLFIEI